MSSDIPKEDLPGDTGANSDPVECLRDAGPAAGSPSPDIAAIRAHTLRSSRASVFPLWQRSRPLAVAMAASVVVMVAVGGIAVGRLSAPSVDAVSAGQASSGPAGSGEAPALPVTGPQQASELGRPNGSGSAASQGFAGVGADIAMADRSMLAYPGSLISLIPSPELGDEASSAPGYRLDGSSVDREALAASLAEAFGLKGKVLELEYGWQVGSSDGSGPQVMVSNDPGVTWSFSNPEASALPCAVVSEPMPYPGPPEQAMPRDSAAGGYSTGISPDLQKSGSSGSADSAPFAPQECPPPGPQMSAEAALAKAKDLVAGLVSPGSVAGVEMEWSSGTSEGGSWVNAWQTVEGQQTQLSWSFSFNGEKLAWANGLAAELRKVDSYPIVGPYTAVARSSEPKFASLGPSLVYDASTTPMPMDVGVATASSAPSSDLPKPAADRVQVWWDPVTATKAKLSLAQYWQPDGTMLLLPAYHVETADGRGTWAVIAVDESAIDFLAPPR